MVRFLSPPSLMLSASVRASVVILQSNQLHHYLQKGDLGRPFLFLVQISTSYALRWPAVPN